MRILFAFILLFSGSIAHVMAFNPPMDYLAATEFCDKADLRTIEGLWTYPEDDVTVLIYRNEAVKGLYDIHVVEAADCNLKAGMKLGEIRESADPEKYNISLCTKLKKGIPIAPCEAVASYYEAKEALIIKQSSPLSLRFNPTRLLPSFWRLVSVSIKLSKESAPEGMIKIYPSYDGNNSTRRAPRYL